MKKVLSSWRTERYKTSNWAQYNAALRERGSLTLWFDPTMQWGAKPNGKHGCQQKFSDAAIRTCLMLKVLFRLPLRQTTGLVASLLGLAGLDWDVPDFSTLSRRMKTVEIDLAPPATSVHLHLLIDSTGIKVEGEGEWIRRKHGASRRRIWRKIHIGIDAGSLDIRAIEVTKSSVGDGPVLPDLLNQIPQDQEVAFVTADGAYDTRVCRDAIANRRANAVIPPRRNARPWKPDTPGSRERNEALRAIKHLGRALWKKWSGYHRRSLVETKMHCIKLLGQGLMAIDFNRQVTEIKARAAVLNTFTKLGTPKTQRV